MIPEKKLKRLSQKSKKNEGIYVKKILRITLLLSKLNVYMICRLRSQIKRGRILASVSSFDKVRKKPPSIHENFVKHYV